MATKGELFSFTSPALIDIIKDGLNDNRERSFDARIALLAIDSTGKQMCGIGRPKRAMKTENVFAAF